MASPFSFQRCAVHWCPPRRLDLVEHVREARLQMVQAGNFGPMFYGLADDETVNRWFPGQPRVGIEANLDAARELIAAVQAEGARYVGAMSMSWHYGDHEAGKGLWAVWEDRLWTPALLGAERPCADLVEALQVDETGGVRQWPIAGRPYRTYSGCLANPRWRAVLRPMIRKAVEDLGVDGLNVHHGFEGLCRCRHCRRFLWPRLEAAFSRDERVAAWGVASLEEAEASACDLLNPREDCPPALAQRVGLEVARASAHLRKEAFDDLFVGYGRSLKPDLLLAQWYHKYNFKPRDERSLLPSDLWARDESFLWYSQGSQKGVTYVDHGWLADMGMPARYLHAAAGDRPFIINKYDWDRWRLSIAEAAAHGGAALAVHWAPHGDPDRAPGAEERYPSRVYRYQRFLADREELFTGARPYSQLAMVYPRRAEVAGESGATDALRRLGRIFEDHHILFDLLLDEHLTDRGAEYEGLVLADIRRWSPADVAFLRWWVEECGGRVLLAGDNGSLREDGRPRSEPPFGAEVAAGGAAAGEAATRPPGGGQVVRLPAADWAPTVVEVRPGLRLDTYPLPEDDPIAPDLLSRLDELLERRWLDTDAPWYVRTRAWQTADGKRLCLHWVNYRQVENLDDEVPLPQEPFSATLRLPVGSRARSGMWLDPDSDTDEALELRRDGAAVTFTVPRISVWGIVVIDLEA